MKNEDIIAMERDKLIERGIIAPSEQLHTYQGWKLRGFTVNKGAYAVAKVILWKSKRKREKNTIKEVIFQKTASLFATHQVSPTERS